MRWLALSGSSFSSELSPELDEESSIIEALNNGTFTTLNTR